jgi:hypothetical protein
VDERRLYAREAFPSMFVYCMDVLHLSEAEAYLRILAARASRQNPLLLTMLADGRLHLTAIALLARHLTCENRDRLLERATHRSKRQILELIAEIAPRPDAPVVVRRLPERTTPATPGLVPNRSEGRMLELRLDGVAELRPDPVPALGTETGPTPPVSPTLVLPLSPGRYKVQFTASAEFHDKLERLRALMGSKVPGCDLALAIEHAVTEKLERLEARRFARTRAPRKLSGCAPGHQGPAETAEAETCPSPSSRHIPAPVRRAVWERDGGRCRYVDGQDRRCKERRRIEFHHRYPFGLGGDHSVSNIRLMCRAHNAYLAECDYGRNAMANNRRRLRSRPAPATAG